MAHYVVELLEIRHYPSMDLLRQPIYTRSRPRTKLARSFQELTKRIRSGNIDDRDGVLERLKRHGDLDPDVFTRIRRRYSDDPGVLGAMVDACYLFDPKRIDLLERIAELETLSPHQLVMLAEVRHYAGDRRGSLRALAEVLRGDYETDRKSGVSLALELLATLGEDRAEYVDGSPIMARLPAAQRAGLAIRLDRSRRERQVQVKILANVLDGDGGSPAERRSWASELASARVAVGDFARAREYYRSVPSEERTIEDAFNLAMATWGDSGSADADAFRPVLDLCEKESAPERRRHGPIDPNDLSHLQAMTVAEWFAGQSEAARQHLSEARQRLSEEGVPLPDFRHRAAISCWSFTRVSTRTFIEHCDDISRLFDGCDVKPVFMRATEDM